MPYQLMYSSQAALPMTVTDLEVILADARAGNEARNITGALVFVDGVFFQILEGDKEVVRAVMANIARDTRHHCVKVFYEAEVDARAFECWRMAYSSPSAGQMAAWCGLAGTATVESLLAALDRDPNRVPRVLINVLQSLAEQSP